MLPPPQRPGDELCRPQTATLILSCCAALGKIQSSKITFPWDPSQGPALHSRAACSFWFLLAILPFLLTVPLDTSDSGRHCIYLACCEFSQPASESTKLSLIPVTHSLGIYLPHGCRLFPPCQPTGSFHNLLLPKLHKPPLQGLLQTCFQSRECSLLKSATPAYGIRRVTTVWTEIEILNNCPPLQRGSIGFHHRVVTSKSLANVPVSASTHAKQFS